MLPQFSSLLQFILDEGENIICDIRTSSAAYIVGSLSQQDREQLALPNKWLSSFSCVSARLLLRNLNESQSPSSHSQKHHKIQKLLGALRGSQLSSLTVPQLVVTQVQGTEVDALQCISPTSLSQKVWPLTSAQRPGARVFYSAWHCKISKYSFRPARSHILELPETPWRLDTAFTGDSLVHGIDRHKC